MPPGQQAFFESLGFERDEPELRDDPALATWRLYGVDGFSVTVPVALEDRRALVLAFWNQAKAAGSEERAAAVRGVLGIRN